MARVESKGRALSQIFGTGLLEIVNGTVQVGQTVGGADSASILTLSLDSGEVVALVDSAYIQARQLTYDFLDSAEVISLIDSAYVAARTTAGTDSAAIISLIDSAYVQERQITYDFLDSAEALALIDSAYIQTRQLTYDFLDSAEALALIDSAYINARVSTVDSAQVLAIVDSAYINTAVNVTKSIALSQQGTLAALTGTARWYAPAALTISEINAYLATAADQTATAVVKKSGTTASTLSFSAASTFVADSTGFSMTKGDYLTVDITATGTPSAPGENLNIQFLYTLD